MGHDLEAMLRRLADLTPAAQERWEAEQREEYAQEDDGDYEPDGTVWFSLEYNGEHWCCGYRVRPDEASEWAFDPAADYSPHAAVIAMLKELER